MQSVDLPAGRSLDQSSQSLLRFFSFLSVAAAVAKVVLSFSSLFSPLSLLDV